MTFPVTLRLTTIRSMPAPGHATPGNSASPPAQIPAQRRKNAPLPWLGINALAGAIVGVLLYHIDALTRWAIRLLM